MSASIRRAPIEESSSYPTVAKMIHNETIAIHANAQSATISQRNRHRGISQPCPTTCRPTRSATGMPATHVAWIDPHRIPSVTDTSLSNASSNAPTAGSDTHHRTQSTMSAPQPTSQKNAELFSSPPLGAWVAGSSFIRRVSRGARGMSMVRSSHFGEGEGTVRRDRVGYLKQAAGRRTTRIWLRTSKTRSGGSIKDCRIV